MSHSKKEKQTTFSDPSVLYRGTIHEIKNKLQFILNNHEYMEDTLSQANSDFTGEFREIIGENRQGLRDALNLLAQSLESSEDGEDWATLNPKVILEDVIRSFGNQLSGFVLKKHIGAFPGKLIGSEARLRLIYSNLIGNSIQCFPDDYKGEKSISLEISQEEPDRLTFVISDSGPGIGRENLEKIFEPGYTTRKSSGGTGRGLAIVKDLVEKDFSGQIIARSEPGKGTVFVVDLPLGRRGL